jgi:hypothetical protein
VGVSKREELGFRTEGEIAQEVKRVAQALGVSRNDALNILIREALRNRGALTAGGQQQEPSK